MTSVKELSQKLDKIKKREENKKCFDCGEKGTTYVCINFGTFICSRCAGILRELNFKVKGTGVSIFNQNEIDLFDKMGNENAAKIWLAKYKEGKDKSPGLKDDESLRKFLKDKYLEKKWYKKPKKIKKDDDEEDEDEKKGSKKGKGRKKNESSDEEEESENDESDSEEEEKESKKPNKKDSKKKDESKKNDKTQKSKGNKKETKKDEESSSSSSDSEDEEDESDDDKKEGRKKDEEKEETEEQKQAKLSKFNIKKPTAPKKE